MAAEVLSSQIELEKFSSGNMKAKNAGMNKKITANKNSGVCSKIKLSRGNERNVTPGLISPPNTGLTSKKTTSADESADDDKDGWITVG
ncbi:hypothetical protein SK128_005435, partial [Halocaridina rubra]